jgi:sugar phosphate isomerase/epimerase
MSSATELALAGHSYAFRDRPLEAALEEIGGLGLGHVEIWLGHLAGDSTAVERAVATAGIGVVAVSAGGITPANVNEKLVAFALAEALGARVVAGVAAPAVLPRLGRETGAVAFCLENHWNHRYATSDDVLIALDRAAAVRACLDTGHALMASEAPDAFASAIRRRLGHVHLKDASLPRAHERLAGRRLRRRFLPRPEPVFPGEGDLDVAALKRALEEGDYRGAVTLEHEGAEPAAALAKLKRSWESSG